MVAPRETEDNDYTFFFFRQGWGGVLWEMCKWRIRELLTSKFLGRNRKKKKIDVLRLTTSTLNPF